MINNPTQEKIESVRMFNILGQSVYSSMIFSNDRNHRLETNGLSVGGILLI